MYTIVECGDCDHCGHMVRVVLPYDPRETYSRIAAWVGIGQRNGEAIQSVFPKLHRSIREAMMTSLHPRCWGAYINGEVIHNG